MTNKYFSEDELILIPMDKNVLWRRKLTPIITTMKLWGLQLDRARQNLWSVVVFIFMHCYLIHMAGYTVRMVYLQESFMTIIENLIFIFAGFIILVSYYRIFYSRSHIDATLSDISNHTLIEFSDYTIEFRDRFRMTLLWLFCIASLIHTIWYFIAVDMHIYYHVYMYGLDPELIPIYVRYPLSIFIHYGYIIWMRAPELLLCFFFGSACRYFTSEFRSIKHCLKSVNTSWNVEPGKQKLLHCMNRYVDLCNAMNIIDHILSPLIFLWILSLSFQITFQGRNSFHVQNHCRDPIYCMRYFIEFTITIVAFIDIFMSANSITLEAQKIAPIVYKVASSTDSYGKDHIRSRVGLWYWKITTDPPRFTGYHTFFISRTFLVAFLSIIIGYIVIMHEMVTK